MPNVGDVIHYDGDEWYVAAYDVPRDSYQLASTTRMRDNWIHTANGSHMSLYEMRVPVQVVVTHETLLADARREAARKDPYEYMRQQLKERGMDPDAKGNESIKNIVDGVADQVQKMSEAFSFKAEQQDPYTMDWSQLKDRFLGEWGVQQRGSTSVTYTEHAGPAWEAQCDAAVSDPDLTGWYLVYEEPDEGSDELFVYARGRAAHKCADLAECWAYADFCIDDELGDPLAIKKDQRVIYLNGDDGWKLVRTDYPPVSTWL